VSALVSQPDSMQPGCSAACSHAGSRPTGPAWHLSVGTLCVSTLAADYRLAACCTNAVNMRRLLGHAGTQTFAGRSETHTLAMAFVRNLVYRQKLVKGIQATVLATWTLAYESGRPIIQIDTYGTAGRVLPGKSSQTLQFDEESALELVRICQRAYPGLLERALEEE